MSVHLEVPPAGCLCGRGCEFPCHDRVGIAEPCSACGCLSVGSLAAMPHSTNGNDALLTIEEALRAIA